MTAKVNMKKKLRKKKETSKSTRKEVKTTLDQSLVTTADLPPTVKIGWRDIRLVPVDASFLKDNADCYGEFLSRESKINFQKEVKGVELGNTVLHEIMHAIAYASSLNQANGPLKEEDNEETTVNSMANWLMGAFRDNPWLLDFLKASLKK